MSFNELELKRIDRIVGEWTRLGVARFRFVRSRGAGQLYWMRRDLKWHRYDPAESTPDLAALVAIVEADERGACRMQGFAAF